MNDEAANQRYRQLNHDRQKPTRHGIRPGPALAMTLGGIFLLFVLSTLAQPCGSERLRLMVTVTPFGKKGAPVCESKQDKCTCTWSSSSGSTTYSYTTGGSVTEFSGCRLTW